MSASPIRLAVLISGGGRTLINLHQRIDSGRLDARIAGVISSRAAVAGVARAREAGLPVEVVSRRKLDDDAFQHCLTDAVVRLEPDLVCMAGFLSLWRIPDALHSRVINIHPALLPDFGGPGMYGLRVHRAVLDAGRAESGCTVHYCDNEYDHGPIILQTRVPVLPGDTAESLAARVFEAECETYPRAIQMIAGGAA
ncbi:MAG: phosphoribosylglycinamide formyltransferase [Phycisphaerales bacterium]|nr:MAG: phosphoribosylglycinamide formyltransferase [Phycisphaerales bacterium]